MSNANKKISQRTVVFVSVLLFSFTLVLSSFAPPKTSAVVPPEEYRSMEKAAIAVKCLELFGVHGSVENKKADDGMIFAKNTRYYQGVEAGDYKARTSGIVETDNDISCANNIRTAIAELGLKYDYDENDSSSFLAKFYKKDGDKLKLKDSASTATAIDMIKKKIDEKGWDELPIPYVKAAVLPKFNECIVEISSTAYTPPGEDGKVPEGNYQFTYNGKYYDLRGGKGAGDSKADKRVGYLVEPDDGVWSCGEMAKILRSGANFAGGKSLADIMIGDAAKEAEEVQNTAAKIEAIREVLNEDPNITIACSASVDAAFGATSATAQINTISTWLANGATGEMNYSAGRSMSEENAKKIAACLNQNIPELQAAIDTELDFDSIDGGSAGDGPSCESEGGVMSWIICPVIFLGDAVLRKLDQAIFSLLNTPNDYIDNDNLKLAWKNLRNIAYMILVPIMLVMVISTALGFDFISAYTIKRALPRMVIAVIFIALSYDIAKFLVVMTNNIGTGIEGLIAQSIAGREDLSLAAIFAPDGGDSATALLVGGAVGVGALAIGSIGIILSYLLVAVVGLAMGFFLLSLRQMLIVMLMILAPVAILAWIFPGNDKLWKLWWGTFSKLLLLFPIIMILITSGKVFAAILAGVGDSAENAAIDSSFVTTLIKLVAYVGPYFMIPAMFKFAGGVFATVSGMANDKGRGLFDRQKKYRGRKAQENWRNTKTGNRFSERNAFTRGFNRAGMGVGAGAKGRFGIGERGRQAMDLKSQAAADEALKNNPELQKLAFNDDANAVMALSGGSKQGAERAARELFTDENGVYDEARAQRAIEGAAAVGFSRSNAQAAMTTLAQNKARSIATGERGRQQIQNGINRLAGGNAQMATNMRDSFAFHASGAGRGDLGATNWNQANAGLAGFERTDLYQAAHSQPHTIEAARDDAVALATSSDPAERQRAAVHLTELQSMLSSATGPSRDAIVESIDTLTPLLEPHMSASDAGPAGPAAPQTRREVFDSDRGSPGHARYDATYVAGWSAADIANGYRDTVVPGTAASNRERARQTARVYQGVDPHNLT